MAGFFGLGSEDWTALGTIMLAIVGAISFVVNYWVIREMRKDRKLGFVRIQLNELYYPLLAEVQEIKGLREKGRFAVEITRLFREKAYLAAPKLRTALENYQSVLDDYHAKVAENELAKQSAQKDVEKTDEFKSSREKLESDYIILLKEKGRALVKAAEEEKAELSERLMKLARFDY